MCTFILVATKNKNSLIMTTFTKKATNNRAATIYCCNLLSLKHAFTIYRSRAIKELREMLLLDIADVLCALMNLNVI